MVKNYITHEKVTVFYTSPWVTHGIEVCVSLSTGSIKLRVQRFL